MKSDSGRNEEVIEELCSENHSRAPFTWLLHAHQRPDTHSQMQVCLERQELLTQAEGLLVRVNTGGRDGSSAYSVLQIAGVAHPKKNGETMVRSPIRCVFASFSPLF